MLRLNILTLFLFSSGLLLSGCLSHKPVPTVEDVTTTVMVTPLPVPAAKETVLVPTGYTTCFTVKETVYQNKWIPAHRVCQYENINGQVIWVDGYWACIKYKKKANGVCHAWQWQRAHWAQISAVY
jgi:hypothetical protein